jgi:hypothetical protein
LITHRKVLMADTRNGFEPPQFTPRWDQAPRTTAHNPHGYGPATPYQQAPPPPPRHETLPDGRANHRSEEQAPPRTGRLDKNKWHWLLLIPIVLPLSPALYNRIEPTLFGLPFFYWCQLSFAFLASAVITFVHKKSR